MKRWAVVVACLAVAVWCIAGLAGPRSEVYTVVVEGSPRVVLPALVQIDGYGWRSATVSIDVNQAREALRILEATK